MQARFLLGPAGSGKTHRCLAEIRAELAACPAGPSLIFLAPKQATFQIERQLLEDGSLAGYTRLQIVSFERLAQMLLEELCGPVRILSEEGRIMVLRAILASRQGELRLFHATARLPGFARELSLVLRELQRHQIAAPTLTALTAKPHLPAALTAKLHDLALLLEAYQAWLKARQLEDPSRLLDIATQSLQAVRHAGQPAFHASHLWLDGFAEMTPQELDFLAALTPLCGQATLAFCLDSVPKGDPGWLSTWAVVSQTFRNCHARLEAVTGQQPRIELLPREGPGRFAGVPALAHLEAHWAETTPPAYGGAGPVPRLVPCASPEAEAILAAREILAHVHRGGRYREVAVLLRGLDSHAAVLKRVFARYEIPCFMDQREPVAHHPLAELTRYALRVLAWNWRNEDWFGALKSGLSGISEEALDELENAALERGWDGEAWLKPFAFDEDDRKNASWCESMESWRQRLTQPFIKLRAALQTSPSGAQLAGALRTMWDDLQVGETLAHWAETSPVAAGSNPAVHATVWEGLQEWLENLELAFGSQALPLREWLPILESGLGQLTVGVIPPALDQVLIGAVDRSRNPELHLTLLLGMNEGRFPAPLPAPRILSEDDRMALETEQVFLGASRRLRLGHERFYGYIACTRPRGRVIVTWAVADAQGEPLNASAFILHLEKMFPGAREAIYVPPTTWQEAMHQCEALPLLLRPGQTPPEPLAELAAGLQPLRDYAPADTLSPASAARLYGEAIQTSVSALERFGMCPFRFFVTAGLRAEERPLFEVDALQIGSFQHEVLAAFHNELRAEQKRWRDVTADEARARIARLAAELAPRFNRGLFAANAQSQFTRDALITALQEFIAMIVEWMTTYQFDPVQVELGFGSAQDTLPAWVVDLGEGHALRFRGRIDRIDLCPGREPGEQLCVVIDYKSSERKLDPLLLEHGIQMQLPAYLGVLRNVPEMRAALGAEKLVPVGVFYVNLRGKNVPGRGRAEALQDPAGSRRLAYQHTGRFALSALRQLDAGAGTDAQSGQFKYRLTKDGLPYKNSAEVMPDTDFAAMLETVEQNLIRMGRDIYAGNARVDPYQKKSELACDSCECRAICRIDFWTHSFRRLQAAEPAEGARNGTK